MNAADLHILLVEDNPGDADLLQETLSLLDEPLEIVHVGRLDQLAASLNQGARVDAILLDLGLPDSTGIATLERANRAVPHLPIIVLTGLDDEALGIEAVRNGAQDYLVKGQTKPRMLLRAIHHAIERKQMQEQIQRQIEELRVSNAELARFNAAMVGRELRMVEMKKEVNALCARLGEPQRYDLSFLDEKP